VALKEPRLLRSVSQIWTNITWLYGGGVLSSCHFFDNALSAPNNDTHFKSGKSDSKIIIFLNKSKSGQSLQASVILKF